MEKRRLFSRGTQRVIQSGQDRAILLAIVELRIIYVCQAFKYWVVVD